MKMMMGLIAQHILAMYMYQRRPAYLEQRSKSQHFQYGTENPSLQPWVWALISVTFYLTLQNRLCVHTVQCVGDLATTGLNFDHYSEAVQEQHPANSHWTIRLQLFSLLTTGYRAILKDLHRDEVSKEEVLRWLVGQYCILIKHLWKSQSDALPVPATPILHGDPPLPHHHYC